MQWPQIEGNPIAEDAIQLGKSLPGDFQSFSPAKVTSIDGRSVLGDSGANSSCPKCIIEIFLDDTDLVTETLKSLAVVTANDIGKWSAALPASLKSNEGIRTTSTTAKYNTIPDMDAGTTTGLSILYTEGGGPGGGNQLYMPLVVNNKN